MSQHTSEEREESLLFKKSQELIVELDRQQKENKRLIQENSELREELKRKPHEFSIQNTGKYE